MKPARGKGRLKLDVTVVDDQLREALIARAERLGLDPASVRSPGPGALVARGANGDTLRLDITTYSAAELDR